MLLIGHHADPTTFEPTAHPLAIDPDRLVRHVVCVGMTGSGKTGLCVDLLEEVATSGVPIIAIDPKGDIANLAYGDLPGVTVTVYTPGSLAGTPIDLVGALAAPPADVLSDDEALSELVVGTAASLLGLVGVEGDPARSPEHLVLQRIIEVAWRERQLFDLPTLVTRIADPPFAKVGVFALDAFWPRKDRLQVAMALSAVTSAPAFAPWAQGVPLDPAAFLAKVDGKTPVSVFYTAHLDEPRRQWFTAQLLDRVVAWSRRQPGSNKLRALVYFDEVWGYLPPYPKNPPAKRPVLALMKQARAVGVGVVLVTQNPVDVDYAALANAGLWMIGRLQTAQDREKVLDGLAGAGVAVDKASLAGWLGRLPSRRFVLRDAGEAAPWLMMSRDTHTPLRGPITREQIASLPKRDVAPAPFAAPFATPSAAPFATPTNAAPPRPVASRAPDGFTSAPPPAPDGYPYLYLDPSVAFSPRFEAFVAPRAQAARPDGAVLWEPALYARLELTFDEGTEFVLERDEHRLFFPIGLARAPVEPTFEPGDLLDQPQPGLFAALPANVDERKELDALAKKVAADVVRGETEAMFRHRALKLEGRAGESRAEFDARVRAAIEDRVDVDAAKLVTKADAEVKRLEERRAKLARDLERHSTDAQYRGLTEVVNVGTSVMGVLFGHRHVGTAVTSAMSRRSATNNATARASQAEDEITRLAREIYEAENRLEEDVAAIRKRHEALLEGVEEVAVKLEANDVKLVDFAIVWIPVTRPV